MIFISFIKITKLSFDEDYQMLINIPEEYDTVILSISNDLDAAYEPINKKFENKIIDFIDNSNVWYSKMQNRINYEFPKRVKSRLLSINILSEDYENDIIFR